MQASTTGLITWTTDRAATSQVIYGVVPYLGFQTVQDRALVTSHSVQLTGLTVGVLYYFKVLSFYWDSLSISDLYSFLCGSIAVGITLEDGTGSILGEDGLPITPES